MELRSLQSPAAVTGIPPSVSRIKLIEEMHVHRQTLSFPKSKSLPARKLRFLDRVRASGITFLLLLIDIRVVFYAFQIFGY